MKFTLNKYAKLDNIENYYYFVVREFYEDYMKYLEKSKGVDPDFPQVDLKFKENE